MRRDCSRVAFVSVRVRDAQLSFGMIAAMEEQPTMEWILRTIREMQAEKPKDPVTSPESPPEGIERAITDSRRI
jgi:hypothetical protein